MPGATPNKGYPYPLGGDRINVATHIKNLAEAVDAADDAQDDLIAGLGAVWASAPLTSPWTGFVRYCKLGKLLFVNIATINPTAPAGAGANMAVLPPGYRPLSNTTGLIWVGAPAIATAVNFFSSSGIISVNVNTVSRHDGQYVMEST